MPPDARELTQNDLVRAERIACKMARAYPDLDPEELMGAARVGLADAARRYCEGSSQFWTYAYSRIRGEIRDVAKRTRRMIPRAVPIEEWHGMACDRSLERRILLRSLLAHVNERSRAVLLEYYLGDQTLREVASKLGLSERHVGQLRDRAIASIRKNLQLAGEGARYH